MIEQNHQKSSCVFISCHSSDTFPLQSLCNSEAVVLNRYAMKSLLEGHQFLINCAQTYDFPFFTPESIYYYSNVHQIVC